MKINSIVAGFAVAGLSVVSTASALPINSHAAGFHANNGSEQQYITHASNGVSNTSGAPVVVMGVPSRNPIVDGKQSVSISGFNADGSVNTCCTVTSFGLRGDPIAGKTTCVTNFNGNFVRTLEFTAEEAPVNASYGVICTLAANGKNRIQAVRVTP